MNWTPLQRETLDAMGLSPYRLASAAPSAQPAATGRAAEARQTVASSTPNAAMLGDAFANALLRAAGRAADAADRDAVLRVCPPPQALRGDARAKRALWPTLRAMRRH
ncbi:MAG: hypothetical protein KA144_01470 [Xanthomonadaceae bacterium]|nr:hypothetical protein [Xanthomonadaceae bacterium]